MSLLVLVGYNIFFFSTAAQQEPSAALIMLALRCHAGTWDLMAPY